MSVRNVLLARAHAHRSALAAGLASAVAALVLTGFIRLSFGPTQPDFAWSGSVVSFVVQASGTRDVTDSSARTAVRLAFRRWSEDGHGILRLAEDASADATRRDFAASDVHLVLWDEDGSTGLFPAGSGIIALTPLVAQTANGVIADADIVFNGRDHSFTTTGQTGAFDVEAVATHEVGHFLGLDHSGGPRSTMFQAIAPGDTYPRGLGRDEQAFLSTAYPATPGSTGALSGTVTLAAGGAGVAFGYVVAVDATTGEMGGAALTDASGRFRITGLQPASYRLYVEPLDGPVTPGDTTRLTNATNVNEGFATTSFPGGPFSVSSGAETASVNAAVAGATGLNVNDSVGGGLIADGQSHLVTCGGPGMDRIVTASVPGTGVRVTALVRATMNGGPAVTLSLVADPTAPRGRRPLELRDAAGNLVVLTAGVEVLDPTPQITRVQPATLGSSGGTIQIDGSGFRSPAFVVVGGLMATDVTVSGGVLVTATAPKAERAGVPVDVVVIAADGQEARLVGALTYDASPLPTSVDPAVGPLLGGTIHRLLGSGFVNPVRVTVNGIAAGQTSLVSPTRIDFVLPPAEIPGPADVTLMSGGVTRVLQGAITYVNGTAPRLDAFTPMSGSAQGGTSVTLSGADFPAGARVLFGGTPSTSVSRVSATKLVAVTPAHPAGAVDVRVVDPATGLTGIAPLTFAYDSTATVAAAGGGSRGGSGCGLAPGAPAPGPGAVLPLVLLLVGLSVRRFRA